MALTPHLSFLAETTTRAIAACLLEGSAVAFFAWILLRFKHSNAGTRFAVWFLSLLAIAVLPWFSTVSWGSSAAVVAASVSAITLTDSLALGVFWVWIAIAAVALARVAIGLWQVHKLRNTCTAINLGELDPSLKATLHSSRRHIRLFVSEKSRVPTAVGFFKPGIILPAWAMQELSSADLNNIILHELAHLQRWDDWSNLAQKILRAVFFFHPAVWWIDNRLSLEREMACDDLVLARTGNPRSYARCLIWLAERVSDKSLAGRGLALAQGAVDRMRHTTLRIMQILDSSHRRNARTLTPAIGILGAFALLCGAGLRQMPELIAFQPTTSHTRVASIAPAVHEGKEPLLSRAAIIPAALKIPSAEPIALATPAKRTKAIRHKSITPEFRRTFLSSASSTPARVHQASVTTASRPIVSQAVFVVFQPQWINGEPVPAFWTVTVWQITVSRQAVQEGIPAKSI